MEISTKKEERGYALIALFSAGYTQGWKMSVPEAFRTALDIKRTRGTINDKKKKLWTQGRSYDFHVGDSFFDTPLAYHDWKAALKVLTLYIQIEAVSTQEEIIYESLQITPKVIKRIRYNKKSKGKAKKVNDDSLTVHKIKRTQGLVTFRVYRPNSDRSAMEKQELYRCTQDDFIVVLQTGKVRQNDHSMIDL